MTLNDMMGGPPSDLMRLFAGIVFGLIGAGCAIVFSIAWVSSWREHRRREHDQ